jgi:HemY protein
MIRVFIFLALVALLALGGAWLADRPGEIALTWLGWRIETSVTVAAIALVVLVALMMLAFSLLRTFWRSPDLVAGYFRQRRLARGERAIVQGLIAVGAGDLRAARKFSGDAARIKSDAPLTLLLNAQTAQLSGDRNAAETAFRAMIERDETKLLGLRGLYVEARRRDDLAAAREFAEEAARTNPALAWAGQAALEFRCASGDWDSALAALDRNMNNRLIDKPTYRRQRAVLLTASALALEEQDRDLARERALEAVKLAPTLVPAAEISARMLAEAKKLRRAGRIIEKAWTANPHPELAQLYAYLRIGDSARDRLTRVQALADRVPGHIEGAIAVARAAIGAQEFSTARAALAPFLDRPTQRVAELMAELEQAESGNEGRAREWMARALRAVPDPSWTADGFVSDRWLPASPVSGRIDALEWKAPAAAARAGGALIENERRAASSETGAEKITAADRAAQPDSSTLPVAASRSVARRDGLQESSAVKLPAEAREPTQADPVIPLLHVPDDPGPEPSAEPEHDAESQPQADNTWWRIRLFR